MNGRWQRERTATTAEVDLWRRAVAEATPLPGRIRIAKPVPRSGPSMAEKIRRAPMQPFLPSAQATRRSAAIDPIDRATLARLKKGRLEIEGRLDLHGMTADQARQNLSAFLRSSQAMGRRAVLVITGRGLDPEGLGRGILKRETPHWLDAMSDIVAGYGAADRKHGGAGALYVRLRRKDKAKRR
jgi:DNA-nicking Smr family endonuclease